MNKITFTQSIKYPFKGMSFINKHKELWKYLLIPLLIDLILCILVLYLFIFQLSGFFKNILNDLITNGILKESLSETGIDILKTSFSIISYIISFILFVFVAPTTFSLFSGILCSISNSYLYDRTREIILGYKTENKRSFLSELKLFFKSLLVDILKLFCFITIMIILLFANFIPVAGQLLNTVLAFVVTSILLGWDGLSSHFNSKDMGFLQQYKFVTSNLKGFMGFGIAGYFIILIPIINIYFLACNAVGSAIWSIDIEKDNT